MYKQCLSNKSVDKVFNTSFSYTKASNNSLKNKLQKRLSWASLGALHFYHSKFTGKTSAPLNTMITTAFFLLNYSKDEAQELLSSIYYFICKNIKAACKKQQSKQNKHKTLPCLVSSLLQIAIDDSHYMYPELSEHISIMNSMD